MEYIIKAPSTLRADILLPASKSISNRALVIRALAGSSHLVPIDNLSDCDDTMVMIKALKDNPRVIDIGAAGTAMRFMTALLAVGEGEHILTGTERMKQRPIGTLVNALRRLGADISYEGNEGFPPLRINGKTLDGGVIDIPGNISSQYISALLMIGPALTDGLEIRLQGIIVSRPYIDLTLWMMREFGADADWTSGDTIVVGTKPYEALPYCIENDWSASSYWYEMVALASDPEAEIRLSGLSDNTRQGDAAVRFIFSMLGVKTEFTAGNGVILRKSNRVAPRLDYDFVNSPDLAQTTVVTCVAKGIPFHFRGLKSLKIKETDRIVALQRELRKLGYVIRVENDCELVWDGERCEADSQAVIDTYEDHRMAMSFAPVALNGFPIGIRNPQVVTKSYPQFWQQMQKAGFDILPRE